MNTFDAVDALEKGYRISRINWKRKYFYLRNDNLYLFQFGTIYYVGKYKNINFNYRIFDWQVLYE